MKAFLILIISALIQFSVSAQNILKVSDSKTSHLVCPDKVVYVQAGDYSIIQTEVVSELSNLIRVKAVQPFEKPTSLTVVCADRIYSFELQYGNDAPITYPIETFDSQKAMTFSGKMMPDYVLKDLCEQVLDQHRHKFRKRKAEKDGIKIRLNSISLKKRCLVF